jgi:GH43 family beta-xylosidase
VLKYCGEYWAYCTGWWADGRCFGVLRSRDLIDWQAVGGAMEPLAESHPQYWAPEVTYDNGRFYLYYSAGDEERMQMRVAVAVHPAGPFVDSGRHLTSEKFAIDGHVFIDHDRAWYLFYATDFLDHQHIGTGTVRDRLLDPYTLAGQPAPVTLPRYEWHVYDPQRAEKGGVRWHTVEGPFVLEHKRRYYQMFSGGNWQNLSYGVSYAVADRVDTPDEWEQVADGERVLPVLRTIPGKVIGPGHNSVVRGPDNLQIYCIYHRWAEDSSARVLAIDGLDWAGDRLLVLGPSTTPQPAPTQPIFADLFDHAWEQGLGPRWDCVGGRWSVIDGAAVQASADSVAAARCASSFSHAVIEVSLRLGADPERRGGFGVELRPPGQLSDALRCLIVPSDGHVVIAGEEELGWNESGRFRLPHDFDPYAWHLLRLEVNGQTVQLALDQQVVRWKSRLQAELFELALITHTIAASFAGVALSLGWQDLFAVEGVYPANLGWHVEDGDGWHVSEQQLCYGGSRPHSTITKGPLLEAYEMVLNVRLVEQKVVDGCYGFYPTVRPGDRGPLFTVESDGESWALVCAGALERRQFALPNTFDPYVDQQFRLRKQGARLSIQWEAFQLGQIEVSTEATQVGLYAYHAVVAFDMVRVTATGVIQDLLE